MTPRARRSGARGGLLLRCLALAAALSAGRAALPAPYDLLYSSTDAILAEFAVLAQRHPERVTWQPPVERSAQFSLGVATFGAPPPGAPRKPNVLIVFGEHARELITSDTALWLGRVLAGARPVDPCHQGLRIRTCGAELFSHPAPRRRRGRRAGSVAGGGGGCGGHRSQGRAAAAAARAVARRLGGGAAAERLHHARAGRGACAAHAARRVAARLTRRVAAMTTRRFRTRAARWRRGSCAAASRLRRWI